LEEETWKERSRRKGEEREEGKESPYNAVGPELVELTQQLAQPDSLLSGWIRAGISAGATMLQALVAEVCAAVSCREACAYTMAGCLLPPAAQRNALGSQAGSHTLCAVSL
jgi:hypothetical protein